MIYVATYDLGNGRRFLDFDNANIDKDKIEILSEPPFIGFVQIEVTP